jgi:hypothetical protein
MGTLPKGDYRRKLYSFAGQIRNVRASNPKQNLKYETGMRFAAPISFFPAESQYFMPGTHFLGLLQKKGYDHVQANHSHPTCLRSLRGRYSLRRYG